MRQKRCWICKKHKDETEFYSDISRYDNLANKCKNCQKVDYRGRYKRLGYNKYSYRREKASRYYHKNIEKIKARYAVRMAIKTGKLHKKPCIKCGDLKSQGHHYKGYEKENWLKIKWLCDYHHKLSEK